MLSSPVYVAPDLRRHAFRPATTAHRNRHEQPPSVDPSFSPLVTRHSSLSPLESAHPQNSRVTRLESALPKSLDLKSFRIRTCKKAGGRGSSVNQLCRHSALAVCRTSSVCTSLQPRPGPPQVAAPITECHNPSFDCTSRLRTPACLVFWRWVTGHESPR